jgi:hypothetical protein|tara:strand:- start:42 stop:650 length:609 start_codon:yes stop_codon:yes gene_type:complete
MFETKRYDADGNLIEVISAEVCTNMFWHQFGEALTIPAHQIDMKTGARGQFHLMPRLANKLPARPCAYCGALFQPPKHKPLARYCFRANVEELQQCRRLSYRDKHLKPQREVQCASCGITYLSSKKNAKFCANKKCNGAALLRQATAKGRKINCNYCGFEFIAPPKGNQKFCIMPYFVNTLQCYTISTKQRKRDKELKKLPK